MYANYAASLAWSCEMMLARLLVTHHSHKTRTRLEYKIYMELDKAEGYENLPEGLQSAIRAAKWTLGQSSEAECTHSERIQIARSSMEVLEVWRKEFYLSPVIGIVREGETPLQNESEIPF